jgi:hypothetical protein
LSDSIRITAERDQSLIDRHPEWFDEPRTTVEEILAREGDAEDTAA